jgi:hypothetical protein
MVTLGDEREERAERWLQQATERMLLVEPDWWLRMECGQTADSAIGFASS